MKYSKERFIKDKKKNLFSQCEVVVQKIDDNTIDTYSIISSSTCFKRGEQRTKDERIVGNAGRGGYRVKCISPLGFYYYKDRNNSKDEVTYKEHGIRKRHIINFVGGFYEISYMTSFNNTSIGHETRPWDLVGNGIADHFIKDLEKVMNDIVAFLHDNIGLDGYTKKNVDKFKSEVFIDLFGDKDGMKAQTNEGKILSHGFDLKMSFRKRKES